MFPNNVLVYIIILLFSFWKQFINTYLFIQFLEETSTEKDTPDLKSFFSHLRVLQFTIIDYITVKVHVWKLLGHWRNCSDVLLGPFDVKLISSLPKLILKSVIIIKDYHTCIDSLYNQVICHVEEWITRTVLTPTYSLLTTYLNTYSQ